jgi:signal transduction histidine kinase
MVRDRPVPRDRVPVAALVAEAAGAVPRPPGVKLEVATPDDLAVTGDAVALRQALVNLIMNAVEAACPDGAVRVSARPDGATVAFAVDDDGPGIPESVRGRIFEPLITSKAHGNGLGLALVKRVAERHGGSVGHEPRPNGGTRFTLRVPTA